MPIVVTHSDTLTPSNKLNDILYAHQHTVNSDIDSSDMSTAMQTLLTNIETLLTALSGKTVKIPVLIETKTLPAGTTTTTFSSLNGDSDLEYLLITNVTFDSCSNDSTITLQPNTLTTNLSSVRHFVYHNSHSYSKYDTALAIATNGLKSDSQIVVETKIYPKTGKNRSVISRSLNTYSTSYRGVDDFVGVWGDSTTNITSLQLILSSGSMSGTIKLYKMVDISL